MAQAARPMTDTRLPTREELVDRARAMKPALRERLPAAREAATLRRDIERAAGFE